MTSDGPQRWAWPDGGALLSQPAITIELFAAFDWAVLEQIREERAAV